MIVLLALAGAPTNADSLADQPSKILLPALRWSVDITAAPAMPPVVADGYIYLALKPGILAARHLKDGAEAWRMDLVADQELASAPELLFVPTSEAIRALAADSGREMWLARTGTVTAPLLVQAGWLVAVSGHTLFALRAADGTQVWNRDAGEVRERPAIDGDELFVSFTDGRVSALDLATGAERWTRKLGGVPTGPLITDSRVYVGCSDKYFYALFRKDGQIDWHQRIGAAPLGRAAADDRHVYVAAMDNVLRALDRTSGSQQWRSELPFRPVSGPVVIGQAILVPGASTELRLFPASTGEPVKTINLGSSLAITPGIGVEPGEPFSSIAAISGDLAEQWKLWVYGPLPPAPEGPQTQPLTVLPGRSARPGL